MLSSLRLFSSSVTGTPLGRAGAERTTGPVSSQLYRKVLNFSPFKDGETEAPRGYEVLQHVKSESWSWALNPRRCPPEPASYPLASRACPTVGLSASSSEWQSSQCPPATRGVVSVEGKVACRASSTPLLLRWQATEWF